MRIQPRKRLIVVFALAVAAVVGLAPARADTTSWSLDSAHTEINFSVNHFFTPVTGTFREFEIDLRYDPNDLSQSSVDARIQVASIDTGNSKRDAHLLSEDFFEAEKHPYMTFRSRSVRAGDDGRLVARGPLTIKGVSREIELPIVILGTQQIPEKMQPMLGGAKQVASFKATTAVDRTDFGVGVGSWAATFVVGDDVEIGILAEAHMR